MESPSTFLETPRLVLREFTQMDAEAVQVYASDPEVTRFTSWGPNSLAETEAVLSRWAEERTDSFRKDWPLAIVRKEDGTLIGGTGLHAVAWDSRTALFGYVLRRSAWGQGYASEAGAAVCSWALGDFGLTQVVANCEPANLASARGLLRIGFEPQPGLVSLQRQNREIRSYLTFIKRAQGTPRELTVPRD